MPTTTRGRPPIPRVRVELPSRATRWDGPRLHARILARGLSTAAIAEALGRHQSTVCRWCLAPADGGAIEPSLSVAFDLAAVLRCSVDDFLVVYDRAPAELARA